MQVIGTAGHVDHGKSTLINQLTGINPDRLKEEQDREMSIELGFAWITLPDGNEIGIVDVPGHRDFIENMLAGVGGIDAVLFVVAADEGVMPQTTEHLAIIDLLQIPAGVIALTKTDLVEDLDWLDLVEADLRDTLAGTVLESAPIVRVSAKTGHGIDTLVESLQEVLKNQPNFIRTEMIQINNLFIEYFEINNKLIRLRRIFNNKDIDKLVKKAMVSDMNAVVYRKQEISKRFLNNEPFMIAYSRLTNHFDCEYIKENRKDINKSTKDNIPIWLGESIILNDFPTKNLEDFDKRIDQIISFYFDYQVIYKALEKLTYLIDQLQEIA